MKAIPLSSIARILLVAGACALASSSAQAAAAAAPAAPNTLPQRGGNYPVGGSNPNRYGGTAVAGLNDLEQTELTRMNMALDQESGLDQKVRDLAAAKAQLVPLSLATPFDVAALRAAVQKVAELETAVALARASGFAKIQASDRKFAPDRVQIIVRHYGTAGTGGGGGRGGGGGGGFGGGGAAPAQPAAGQGAARGGN